MAACGHVLVTFRENQISRVRNSRKIRNSPGWGGLRALVRNQCVVACGHVLVTFLEIRISRARNSRKFEIPLAGVDCGRWCATSVSGVWRVSWQVFVNLILAIRNSIGFGEGRVVDVDA